MAVTGKTPRGSSLRLLCICWGLSLSLLLLQPIKKSFFGTEPTEAARHCSTWPCNHQQIYPQLQHSLHVAIQSSPAPEALPPPLP